MNINFKQAQNYACREYKTTSYTDLFEVSLIGQTMRSTHAGGCLQVMEFCYRPEGGGVLRLGFAGYVPLASQNPNSIIVYSVANYRPHLSHFWANVIVISRTEFSASQMLNIKTTAGTILQPRIFLFLNPCLPELSYPKNTENLRSRSSNSTENVTPL